jgi:predicted nucleic acid-binding Zn ribbon protein
MEETKQNQSSYAIHPSCKASEDRPVSSEQVLQEILENTRKTKKYLQWQFYITIVLVVLPLLAMLVLLPMVMSSLGSVYGGGLLQ